MKCERRAAIRDPGAQADLATAPASQAKRGLAKLSLRAEQFETHLTLTDPGGIDLPPALGETL